MTTAAPPEKMMLGDLPCPACGETPYDVGHGAVTCHNNQCALREIRISRLDWNLNARRLIGTMVCPLCGIDTPHRHDDLDELAHGMASQLGPIQSMHTLVAVLKVMAGKIIRDTREASRRLAPRVGDDVEPTDPNFFIHVFWPSHDKFKMLLLDVVKRRDAEWRALSAPPAASAEREELAALLRSIELDSTWPDIADAILAAGYRKRAAQVEP